MAARGQASERLVEHHDIARDNGARILARPQIALDAITHTQATFTTRDLARFVHRNSEGQEQFDNVMAAVRASPELLKLGRDGQGQERFTSRDMVATEQRLETATIRLDARRHHGVPDKAREQALARAEARGLVLSLEQGAALERVTDARGLSVVVGYAGTGKSAMLGVAREAWEAAGYRVQGAALSGIAAENLESGSGIESRTIASLEHQWSQDRELLGTREVLVIDEAGMIGTRQMDRVIAEAEKRGSKVVLVGDPEQLQAIEAGAAFRSVHERHGGVEIMEVRRQHTEWQRGATRQLATGRTDQAIAAYERAGHVHVAETREAARAALIERWEAEREAAPDASRIILTHTNDEVQALNHAARNRLQANGALGPDVSVQAERGERQFACGDRIMFLSNERGLGVKNGSLGMVESVTPARMAVTLDDGRNVAFDLKDYAQVDHGYAATIHKAQGMTVDRVHVLATPGLDRHAAYVALSRHRDGVELHYGRDDFADRDRLAAILSRERAKDMVADYASAIVSEPAHQQRASIPTQKRDPAKLDEAIQRHGRIVRSTSFRQSVGEALTAEQTAEVAASRAALNAIRPNAARDLESAMRNDLALVGEAADGRTAKAIRAMQLEAEMRVDPQLRADTFVQRWQTLDRQRRSLLHDHQTSRADHVADRMMGMAKSLERDPQVDSLLRQRNREFGIGAPSATSIAQDLQSWVGRTRGRGLGI